MPLLLAAMALLDPLHGVRAVLIVRVGGWAAGAIS